MEKLFLVLLLFTLPLFTSYAYELPETKVNQISQLSQLLINRASTNDLLIDYINQLNLIKGNYKDNRSIAIIERLIKNLEAWLSISNYYEVIRVVDWDTIIVYKNWLNQRVRLIWIDTPEIVHPTKPVECFWKESSLKANELLLWKNVKLIKDKTQDDKDIYGRLLRYVFLEDWLFYNAYMIENWFAFEYTFRNPYEYQTKFKLLEDLAKNNKLWFWSPDNCDWNLLINNHINESELNNNYHFYTSSHSSARLYYCETDNQWKWLSENYLMKFNSSEELLENFPDRTLNKPCN